MRHHPARVFTSDAKHMSPLSQPMYSGLTPIRSRARKTPSSAAIATANGPVNRSTNPGPHSAYRFSTAASTSRVSGDSTRQLKIAPSHTAAQPGVRPSHIRCGPDLVWPSVALGCSTTTSGRPPRCLILASIFLTSLHSPGLAMPAIPAIICLQSSLTLPYVRPAGA